MAETAPSSPARAPTDRSIWPATITSTMPMARIEVTAICRASSDRLRGLRNVPSVMSEKTIQITSSAPTIVSARQGIRNRGAAAGPGAAATCSGGGGALGSLGSG